MVIGKEIQIVSYNVENLFDYEHDEGKEDFTFLPFGHPLKEKGCRELHSFRQKECLKTNWTKEKYEKRISHISYLLKQLFHNQIDVLALVEVENPKVVKSLAKKLKMKSVYIAESLDKRGVDVALLIKNQSVLKFIAQKSLRVELERPSRDILEVETVVGREKIYFFVNHWPSLANPQAFRMKAAGVLKNRIQEIMKISPEAHVIALGDFNTVDEMSPHPIKELLLRDNEMVDLDLEVDPSFRQKGISGTYFYPKQNVWDKLDRFLISSSLLNTKNKIQYVKKSAKIAIDDQMLRERTIGKGWSRKKIFIPKKFDPDTNVIDQAGFSDHLPISMKLKY